MGGEVDGSGELQQVEEELQQVDAVAWNELHRNSCSKSLHPSKQLQQLQPLAPINIAYTTCTR
jgi:hypothetical protein